MLKSNFEAGFTSITQQASPDSERAIFVTEANVDYLLFKKYVTEEPTGRDLVALSVAYDLPEECALVVLDMCEVKPLHERQDYLFTLATT